MSFGASPSDIIIVVKFCKSLYRKCRTAGGEYDEISREVRNLHTVLRHLNYEIAAPDSALNKDGGFWEKQLGPIIEGCDNTLRQLDGVITKYGRLAGDDGGDLSPRIIWERMKFGSNELDTLGGLRVKLISHKTSLSLFLDTIQLQQSGKMVESLDNQSGQLDVILDKVDRIATKMQTSGGSVLTHYDDDDREVWRQFRRELVAEGFSSDVLQQHKDVLRAYIREIDTKGLLEDVPVDAPALKPQNNQQTERWLDNVKSLEMQGNGKGEAPVGNRDGSPLFESLHTPDEQSMKTVMIQEENLKFPQSMRMERPKPGSRHNSSMQQLDPPARQSSDEKKLGGPVQRATSPLPRLVTSPTDDKYEKDHVYLNTYGSSESDTTEDSSVRSRSPSYGQIITTTNLIALSQALTVHSQSSPISSFNSQISYLDDVSRSITYQPNKQIEFSASPQQPGAMPIPTPVSANGDRPKNAPRPLPVHLAPDAHGKEIPPDAKWTKISRRLVSPEVLDQCHKRYEARPEFVAVLGVLSRAEIQDLAARSEVLRNSRRRRHFPPMIPPPHPPRPSHSSGSTFHAPPQSRSIPIHPHPRRGHDTLTDESDTSSSESDHRPREQKVKPKSILKNRNENYRLEKDQLGSSGYPNPYGAPPSPVWSPTSGERELIFRDGDREKRREGERVTVRKEGDREVHRRDGERKDHSRHHHGSSHSHGHGDHGHREKEREKEKEKKSRWKDNLTSAGIGGAAATLINVLAEAAEGI